MDQEASLKNTACISWNFPANPQKFGIGLDPGGKLAGLANFHWLWLELQISISDFGIPSLKAIWAHGFQKKAGKFQVGLAGNR